jgi:hypothetical protein
VSYPLIQLGTYFGGSLLLALLLPDSDVPDNSNAGGRFLSSLCGSPPLQSCNIAFGLVVRKTPKAYDMLARVCSNAIRGSNFCAKREIVIFKHRVFIEVHDCVIVECNVSTFGPLEGG